MPLPVDYKRLNLLLKKLGLQLEKLAIERDLPEKIKEQVQMEKKEKQFVFQVAFSVIYEISKHLIRRIYNKEIDDPWTAFQFLSNEKIITFECANGLLKLASLDRDIKHYYWIEYYEQIDELLKSYLKHMESFSSQIINFLMANPPETKNTQAIPLTYENHDEKEENND